MLFNAILMGILQIILAAAGYWAAGWNVGDSVLLQHIVRLLVSWLAGILCFLAGYRMKILENPKKNVLSVFWLTFLAVLLGAVSLGKWAFPLHALALPFLPLAQILGFEVQGWMDALAVFAPLLALAGTQIKMGKQGGRQRLAIGIMVFYLILLLGLPVVGLMMRMF